MGVVLAAVAVTVTVTVAPAAAQAQSADGVSYSPPVDAPVIDPFRPPPQPWLSGNRGIEYQTAPGTAVHAAADGLVTFAGSVAGSLHVTLQHGDGIRTSYSFLVEVRVSVNQDLRRGGVVGVAGSRFHVGARRGDVYIDPESLWGSSGPPWVRLAPTGGDGSSGVDPPAGVAPSDGGFAPRADRPPPGQRSRTGRPAWLRRPRPPWWDPDR